MTEKKLKICLVAAEPSADILGASLVKALKNKYKQIEFMGVGGTLMEKEGFVSLYPQEKICAMGLFDVIKLLPSIIKHFLILKKEILKNKPDILITIDAPDFNFRLIKKLQGLKCFKAHYVAPSVWAWRKGRAKMMAKYYDHVFALLPFEPPYFEAEGLGASFVGHPLIEKKIHQIPADTFRKENKILNSKKICLLLPGRRKGVIARHLPIIKKSVKQFSKSNQDWIYYIPTLPHLEAKLTQETQHWDVDVNICTLDEIQKYELFRSAEMALAVSGTVSVELALAQVPTIIMYRLNPITEFLARMIISIKYATILNILFDREIYPEFLLPFCKSERLSKAMVQIVEDKDEQAYIHSRTKLFAQKLTPDGAHSPSQKIVEILKTHVQK